MTVNYTELFPELNVVQILDFNGLEKDFMINPSLKRHNYLFIWRRKHIILRFR